jgi:tRNA (adenine22-N1)-methyltransferase
MISAVSHADIGSDHGALLRRLLISGRIRRGIAIENKQQPYHNSRRALSHLDAEVRFGNGLAVLARGEVESLSVCGMGAESIVKILRAFPDRLPNRLVLQPNRQPELIRRWALHERYHLDDEQIVYGHWPYTILSLRSGDKSDDPAYHGVERDVGLLLGPLIAKRADPQWIEQLREEERYLSQFARLGHATAKRLTLIRSVLAVQPCG